MSRSIGQTLPLGALHGNLGALPVIDAQLLAGVHAEIEFGQISRQMRVVTVLINADHSSFEDREVAFCSIGSDIAARPFELRVIYALMIDHQALVIRRLVGMEGSIRVNMLADHALDL